MNQNPYLKNKRASFIKLVIKDTNKASNKLIEEAQAMKNCKTKQDKIFALSQIFCVSESTIEKNLYSEY